MMKVKHLIKRLQDFNLEAEITINDSETSRTRDIWYLEADEDKHYTNTNVDIVLTKEREVNDE
tara:strand:- start:173 stop:361 length:189 start_codon:yes stop_codon:yes gene_type:complete